MSRIFLRFNALPSPEPVRAPLLERALARGAARAPAADWRAAAFALVASGGAARPGVAAAALLAEQGAPAAGAVFVATPLHCQAGLVSVRLPANGLLALDAAEGAQLAARFNEEFAGAGPRLIAGPSGRLYCLLPQALSATTHDPQRVRGRDIGDYLPAGPEGAVLRRLMSEIEMWLYQQPLNGARVARGEIPITGLWLWGGGEPIGALPSLAGWTAGEDPLFSAWPGPQSFPAHPGAGVIVIDAQPGSAAWDVELRTWVAPALAALRRGRIGEVQLSIGEQLVALSRAHLWRLWRRPRPWWEAFG